MTLSQNTYRTYRLVLYMIVLLPFSATANISITHDYFLASDTIVIKQKDTTITYIPLYKQNSKQDSTWLKKKDPIVEFFNKNASKRQINKWIYDLLITEHKPPGKKEIDYNKDFNKIKGKRIAGIRFKKLPPFGSSVNDTTRIADTWMEKAGNKTRIPTSTLILRNNITLKEGDIITRNKIEESERLLRHLGYISNAKIMVSINEADTNMVDILVISKDQFPHAFDAGLIHNYPRLKLYSLNLFGQGLGFSQSFTFTPKDDPEHGFATGLRVKNVYGSLIDINSLYTKTNIKQEVYLKADRSFYRFDTKNAGGLIINRSYKNYSITGSGQIYLNLPLEYFITDIWLGHAFTLSPKNVTEKLKLYIAVQNIISKFYNVRDSLTRYHFFEKNYLYFASLTLAKRNYFKNSLIYSFGRPEDVPYGFMASVTAGYNTNPVVQRPYIGLSFNMGRTIVPNIGYLAITVDANTFLNKGAMEQGTLRLTGTFISRLMKEKCCKIRSFFDILYLKGFDRLPFEYTYLKESKQGITGLSSLALRGKEKFVARNENVFFKYRKFWGFQFAFFSFVDIGFIGDGRKKLFSNKAYVSFGGGLRIRNDNLVFKTIQIRLAFMPNLPPGITPYDVDLSGRITRKFNDFYPKIPFKPTFY